MNLSELIKALQALKKEYGDLPVLMAADSEGNAFGYFSAEGTVVVFPDFKMPKAYIFYPSGQACTPEELLEGDDHHG